MKRSKRALCVLLALFQFAGLLAYQTASGQTRAGRRGPVTQVNRMNNGLQVKLSEGTPVSELTQPVSKAPAVALSESDTQGVLRRLEPIKAEAADEQDFVIRERSLAPPRTGKTVNASFPPAAARDRIDKPETGPLEVVRYSPEGDVPLAPQLSVTFSAPMVAVTSHADSVAEGVPVRLTPQPAGRWRWVGAKTLLFETDTRFPMATEYTVEVPAGTKSASGATLAAAKRWKFVTPPPQVKTAYPVDGPQRRDPLMFVEFDQRINPEAVLKTIKLSAGRSQYRLRLASKEEIDADPTVKNLVAASNKERWLAFRVVDSNGADSEFPLPADASVSLSIGPGTPSLEGPRATVAPQQFSFRTYGPLRVTTHRCGWERNCSPFDQWSVEFSNPLDAESFQQSQVKVEPEIAGMKTALYGNMLSITGVKRGRTSYRVTLDPSIRDQFGQTLGATPPMVFDVGSAPPALASSGNQFIVLDPAAQPRFSVFSVNHPNLKVRLYSVGPEHWPQFADYMRRLNEDNAQHTPPGRLVYSDVVAVKAAPDEMAETRIDLSRALDGGFGQVVVVVESNIPPKNRWDRQRVVAWAQATQIGLDAFVDGSELVAWATSLKDGKPLAGARVTINPATTAATTEENGVAHLALRSDQAKGPNVLVARLGRDVAILPENTYWWNERGGWVKREAVDSLRWFVFDDRKMYRPGEEVRIKGWVRRVGGGKDGDVNLPHGAARTIAYTLRDSRGNEVLKGAADLNMLGGFDTAFKLPPTMNLGHASLMFQSEGVNAPLAGLNHTHQFQVQEFRRPEFEVTATASE
ncbi:MAG TPA: Ig-like domain-containing protein, partial [Blastocatellia bacterium]|nr:Ig-like domain-containing protein [Blastocatellia bacterium]